MIFGLFFLVLFAISEDVNEGDVGFFIECHVFRNMSGSGCSTPGEFEAWWFFTTYGNVEIDLDARELEHIPECGYELTWKNEEEYLEHHFACRDIGFDSKCTAGDDDYEFCIKYYSGKIGECYNDNQIRCRRNKFRYCPAGHYFHGVITEMCKRCQSHYFSPDLNTDLNCTYCPYPTKGFSCDCPAGTYVTPEGCKKCPPGEFQNLPGQVKCNNCSSISPFAFTDDFGSKECKTCAHVVSEGGSECMKCSPGSEWSTGDSCVPCDIGEYNPDTTDKECQKCSNKGDHYYQDKTGQSTCKECAHPAESIGTECMTCSPGKEWIVGDTCSPCKIGEYNPDETDKPCLKCSDGGQYFYSNTTGQTGCLTCNYPVWEGYFCAPPCPHEGTGTRGSKDKQSCLCPTLKPESVTVTSAYDDTDDLCSIAVYENIIDKDTGGPLVYYNGVLSYQFGSDETVTTNSISLEGEGPHTHPVDQGLRLQKTRRIIEKVEDLCVQKIETLQDENKMLRETIQDKEEYFYELSSIVEEIIDGKNNNDWEARMDPKRYEELKKHGVIDKLKSAKLKLKNKNKSTSNLRKMNRKYQKSRKDSDIVRDAGDYDPRPLFPDCPWSKFPLLEQGVCGSCFAYAVMAAMSYRFCIQSHQEQTDILGIQEILSCGTGWSCAGGYATDVYKAMETRGTTTEECYSYTAGRRGEIKKCQDTCDDGSEKKKYYVKKDSINSDMSSKDAMDHMQSRGPITATFSVYEDFLVYDDGVYIQRHGDYLFDHEVACIGFGTDENSSRDYWLCENSWGPDFGQDGYFKILRGEYLSALSDAQPDFLR